MRIGESWMSVRIRNASRHGMMVEVRDPPDRGTYIEIRRGSLIVIGRVAWSGGGRFGFRSQDVIDVDGLMAPPSKSSDAGSASETRGERRRDPARLGAGLKSEERSRYLGSLLQYTAFAGAAAFAALIAAGLVTDILSRPLNSISRALGN